MKKPYFSSDIVEFLNLLYKYNVRYLIVGGEAVIYYGHARLTGDIDVFYDRERDNSQKLFEMLNEFWQHNIPGIKKQSELMQEGAIFQFGVPPNRIDLMNEIEKTDFNDAWKNKKEDELEDNDRKFKVYYIGINELIKNKKAVNRFKDKEDIKFLSSKTKK